MSLTVRILSHSPNSMSLQCCTQNWHRHCLLPFPLNSGYTLFQLIAPAVSPQLTRLALVPSVQRPGAGSV